MSICFASPFPSDVGFALLTGQTERLLAPEEQASLSPNASARRKEQFRLGRAAAAQALKELGFDAPPAVLKGARGEPLWPEAVVGSISHTDRMAAAAVGRSERYRGLGVDLQSISSSQNLSPGVLRRIASAAESEWALSDDAKWRTRTLLLFSAKESIFKALYPILRQEIGFKQAALNWEEERGLFSVSLDPSLRVGLQSLSVKALATENLILTGVALSDPAGHAS